MNSPSANIFLALQEYIAAQVTEVAYIDHELGQFDFDRPPVAWPAVLIDLEDFNFTNMAELVQNGKGIIKILLGFTPYSNTSSGTPTVFKEKGLNYYEIEQKLYVALQGWSPGDDFGKLIRVNIRSDKRRTDIRIREILFSLKYDDYSAKKQQQMATPGIGITGELQGS